MGYPQSMPRLPEVDRQGLRARRRAMGDRLRQRTVGPVSVVPTMLTLANLVCGFAAIHYATKPLAETAVFGWTTITVGGNFNKIVSIFIGSVLFSQPLLQSSNSIADGHEHGCTSHVGLCGVVAGVEHCLYAGRHCIHD